MKYTIIRKITIVVFAYNDGGFSVNVKDETANYETGGGGKTEVEALQDAFAQYFASRGDTSWLIQLKGVKAQ